jgi:hypothetical protein
VEEKMIPWNERKQCPDCRGLLRAVMIFDDDNQREFAYTAADAAADAADRLPIEGRVKAKLCTSCHRLVLFAEGK